jgi:transcriptional regulator with XRE-family HTH domain
LTQSQVAAALRVATSTYRNYELGIRMIPTNILIDVARFYQVRTDYILGLSNEKKPSPPPKKKADPAVRNE